MPNSPPRPCRHSGCGQLVRDGSGYCPAHQADKKAGRFADHRRGSSSERGYGATWQKMRIRVMQRDSGLCQSCLAAGRVIVATEVDHIIPKFEGGTDADDNLQAICVACHKAKTAAESLRAKGAQTL